jgi:orotidine-5'-phosphate decarboxylase
VALDFAAPQDAMQMAERLDPTQCRVKVGKELFTAAGPDVVRALVQRGFDVFLDLKFHDIPNTVAGAVRAAASLGVWMINVHACGGRQMLRAASSALADVPRRPLLIAVTVLTSLDDDELHEVGVGGTVGQQVVRLTRLSIECGLDGVVCSAREAALIRSELGAKPILVTPGIRPPSAPAIDQKRTVSPREAIAAGSNFLVVGRPITASSDPGAALRLIMSDMSYRIS